MHAALCPPWVTKIVMSCSLFGCFVISQLATKITNAMNGNGFVEIRLKHMPGFKAWHGNCYR
jgi:hypothetical protein